MGISTRKPGIDSPSNPTPVAEREVRRGVRALESTI
jgi:hypothetical protein